METLTVFLVMVFILLYAFVVQPMNLASNIAAFALTAGMTVGITLLILVICAFFYYIAHYDDYH